MIKAIVFDFEGPIWTLGDRTVFNEASKEKGLKEDVFSKLARQYFDGAHVGEFADYDDFYKKVNPKTELSLEDFKEAIEQYDNTRQYQSEVIKLIEQLKPKYIISLFSNFGGNLVNYLNDLGITELFEHIVNSYDLGEEKPNKEAYIKMLEVIGMRPEEVIFIDDKPSNVAGAEAVGIKSIIFQNSKQLKEDLSRIIDF